MQQAARASDFTVFMNMAEDRAGYVVEQGADGRDLHEPDEPADRGLRVRSVRLSERTDMTDLERRAGTADVDEQVDELAAGGARTRAGPPGPHARRDALDRRSRRSRTPSCGWAPSSRTRSGARARRSTTHDAELALDIIKADARINDAQREVSRLISVDDRHPAARSPATCATC